MDHVQPIVIVTGVGRTGTTAVARVIHNRFGIQMSTTPGTELFQKYAEDVEMHTINRRLVMGEITLNVWRRAVELEAEKRSHPWGFKDPRTSLILGLYAQMWPAAKWVWCKRDWESTLKSWVNVVGSSEELATMNMSARSSMLENFFAYWPHYSIDLTERLTGSEIERQLIDISIDADGPAPRARTHLIGA